MSELARLGPAVGVRGAVAAWCSHAASRPWSAGVVVVRRPLPQVDGTMQRRRALTAKVEVLRDDHGIPQVYADTSRRPVLRAGVRAGAGPVLRDGLPPPHDGRPALSELFGESTVETDMYIRTMGWRRVAEQELRPAQPGDRRPTWRPTATA